MEVLKSGEGDEVLVIARWQDRVSFEGWVRSEESCIYPHAQYSDLPSSWSRSRARWH
jgi:hypothetical protein